MTGSTSHVWQAAATSKVRASRRRGATGSKSATDEEPPFLSPKNGFGVQHGVAGCSSVRGFTSRRRAGATARTLLVAAAAKRGCRPGVMPGQGG